MTHVLFRYFIFASVSRPIGARDEWFLIKNDSAALLSRGLTALSVSLMLFFIKPTGWGCKCWDV